MIRKSRISAVKVVIVIVSMLLGAGGYTGFQIVSAFSNHAEEEVRSKVGAIELNKTIFDGEFQLVAQTEKPVDLGFDSSGGLYFLSQSGRIIKSITDSEQNRVLIPYHDLETKNFSKSAGCEVMAFHPDFSVEQSRGCGKFYVVVSEQKGSGKLFEPIEGETHQEVLYEFSARDHRTNRFEGTSRELLRIGGMEGVNGVAITELTFDPQGFLYIGVSDSQDPKKSQASELDSIYGKVLRIDPLIEKGAVAPYRIPVNNPFQLVKSSLPELWSYGLRNPHSVSFDPFRDWVCVSDSGVDMLEEINISSEGAEFFGWNLSEGSYFYPPVEGDRVGDGIVFPQIEYARGQKVGKNVGGIIYRGERFPSLDGKVVFMDESGQLISAEIDPKKRVKRLAILKAGGELVGGVRSLKTGPDGEIFVLCEDGKILELGKARPMQTHQYSHIAMLASIFR